MTLVRFTLAMLAAAGLCIGAARAADTATTFVRVSNPPGFGRVIIDLPPQASAETTTEGPRTRIALRDAGVLRRSGPTLRNVVALDLDEASVTLVLVPGARLRPMRFGTRQIFDVLDPPPAAANQRAASLRGATLPATPQAGDGQVPAKPPAAVEPDHVSETAAKAAAPAASEPEPTAEPDAEPVRRKDPVIVKRPVPFVIPADVTVGAAAFRRDGKEVVVLDRRLPVELPPGSDVVVSPGSVTTVVEVPLPPEMELHLARTPAGWSVDVADRPAASGMTGEPAADGMSFSLPHPGRVVSVLDPATGAGLLVGTSLAADDAAAVGPERHAPEYTVLPTHLGVVVEPMSDSVDLHRTTTGFTLRGARTGLKPITAEAAAKRFDFPSEPIPNLMNRLKAHMVSAATAPPRARSAARGAAAQAMLSLGMAIEAHALMQTVIDQDPQAAADASVAALSAIAAVASGRLDEAAALDDPRLADVPEIALWRGVRDRRLGRESDALAKLPALVALARSYPEPLLRLIWPDVAEAVVSAGATLPAEQLTPFAAAMQLEQKGDVDAAIAAWQALADSIDQFDRVRAAVRVAELRLAAGRITPAVAGDLIERQTLAWRGDAREVALRLRAAELRAASGQWRQALDFLRETETLFPDQVPAIRPRKAAVFEQMVSAEGGALAPLEVVLLAADYADCIPQGRAGGPLAGLLADKLLALDLPARAIPVLQGLVLSTPAGPARAEFGARLGQALLEGGDAAGARSALLASAAPDLSTGLRETRDVLLARTMAAQGDLVGAVADLKSLATAQADEARASLLAAAGEWQGSLDALSDLASKLVPATGALSDAAQAIVLRQAQAAARIPNPAALQMLERQATRLSPARSDQLRILTQAPVRSAADLPRAAKELQLARSFSTRS